MAKSIKNKEKCNSFKNAVKELNTYIFKRLHSVYPYLIVSTVLALFVNAVAYGWSIPALAYNMLIGTSDLFLAQNYGCNTVSATQVVWYLSAMFFALWILYPIIRRFYDIYVFYIAPILIMGSMGFLIHNYGSLNCPHIFYGLINTGFVRSISMISLGAITYEVSKWFKTINFTFSGKLLIKVIQVISFVGIFMYMLLWENLGKGTWDYFCLATIVYVLICILSGNDAFEKLFSNKFSVFLGKTSILIFLNHYYWFTRLPLIIKRFNLESIQNYDKFIALFLSLVSCIVVGLLTNLYYKYEIKIKRIFIRNKEGKL